MKRPTMILLVLVLSAACGASSDAAAPDRLRPFIEGARSALEREADGPAPRSFRFVGARCREDGGVVLLFEQSGGFRETGLAFALSDTPSADDGDWAGGFAPIDPATDPEIRLFFQGHQEVGCG